MNADNPYAPPKADVADVVPLASSPALWNPNAAASWSLLLSPIFGAWLHMKNWQAMGEPAKAARAKQWALASAAYFVLLVLLLALLPESGAFDLLGRLGALVLLLSWYYASGKPQSGVVLARYGKHYPRKGWGKPLLFALLGYIGFFVAAGIVGFIAGLVTGSAP